MVYLLTQINFKLASLFSLHRCSLQLLICWRPFHLQMNCECALVPDLMSPSDGYSEVIRPGVTYEWQLHIWQQSTFGISPIGNLPECSDIWRYWKSEWAVALLLFWCPVLLAVICGSSAGSGLGWVAPCLQQAEGSAVQALGTHSKSHTGPQPVCDRAEEDGAPASERARPVVFEASHWKADTFAGGFVQPVLAKTHWMNK